MYYCKRMEGDIIVSLYSYNRKPILTEGLVEISKKEFEELQEYLSSQIQESNEPTYAELQEAYTILTGGDDA